MALVSVRGRHQYVVGLGEGPIGWGQEGRARRWANRGQGQGMGHRGGASGAASRGRGHEECSRGSVGRDQ